MVDDTQAGSDRVAWVGLLVVAAIAFAIAALRESAAAASYDNCGELPGIARMGTLIIGSAIAIAIMVIGAIAGAIGRRGAVAGVAVVIGVAIIAGLVVGSALTRSPAC